MWNWWKVLWMPKKMSNSQPHYQFETNSEKLGVWSTYQNVTTQTSQKWRTESLHKAQHHDCPVVSKSYRRGGITWNVKLVTLWAETFSWWVNAMDEMRLALFYSTKLLPESSKYWEFHATHLIADGKCCPCTEQRGRMRWRRCRTS